MAIPLLLDTDIGSDVDDALALAYAALDPRIDLVGVTTVNGDPVLRARIARTLLRRLGRDDVPVGVGAAVGLDHIPRPGMPGAVGHEERGLALDADAAFPTTREVMVAALERARAPVTVVAIGAVTNVAALLSERPDLCDRVDAVHLMGGCFGPVSMGDAAATEGSPFDEFNLGCDPLAAAVLFGLPVALRIVPVDVTMPLCFTAADRAAIRASGPFGRIIDALSDQWLALQQAERPGRTGDLAQIRLHDPLAVVATVERDIVTTEELTVAVHGTPGRVTTAVSAHGRPATVVRTADGTRLRRILVECIASAPRGSR